MSYPVFINLKDMKVVFVGGGRIARRKIKNILGQGAEVTIVAPVIIDEIRRMAIDNPEMKLVEEQFDLSHIEDASLVFVVSDNDEVNQTVTDYCRSKGILINNCMDSSQSTFNNGAVIRRGELELAIGTGGKRPGVAKWMKESIDKSIPESIDKIMSQYDILRADARINFTSSKEREQYIKEAFKEYIDSLEGIDHEN